MVGETSSLVFAFADCRNAKGLLWNLSPCMVSSRSAQPKNSAVRHVSDGAASRQQADLLEKISAMDADPYGEDEGVRFW
jgi:hypothetical protein